MTTVIRGEKLYQNTCLQIPYDLKQAAKEQGINMTQVLVQGIEERLKECDGEKARSRPAPSPERIGSIRINIFMDEQKEWLIERVNAGMGEWEYVISYLGEYFATAPSESIAREIQEAYSDRSAIAAQAREDENKRIVKILEDYRFGLDYPDCPPGDTIKKLVNSLRTGGDE